MEKLEKRKKLAIIGSVGIIIVLIIMYSIFVLIIGVSIGTHVGLNYSHGSRYYPTDAEPRELYQYIEFNQNSKTVTISNLRLNRTYLVATSFQTFIVFPQTDNFSFTFPIKFTQDIIYYQITVFEIINTREIINFDINTQERLLLLDEKEVTFV